MLVNELLNLHYQGYIKDCEFTNAHVDNDEEIDELCLELDELNELEETRTNMKKIEEIEEKIQQLEEEANETKEAYERWLVNGRLADKLKEKGEMFVEIEGEERRGRQTTGQAILLDYVIGDIYADLYATDKLINALMLPCYAE